MKERKIPYPPSRCSLNILSKARQSSKIVYNWAWNHKVAVRTRSVVPLFKTKDGWKNLTPASTAMGLPRWSISDSSSSMLLLINDVMLGILALITDSRCWNGNTYWYGSVYHENDKTYCYANITQSLYPWKKFCKIFRTHFTGQMPIIRTCSKIFTLPSSCCNHIHIFVDISLWSVYNTHPRLL